MENSVIRTKFEQTKIPASQNQIERFTTLMKTSGLIDPNCRTKLKTQYKPNPKKANPKKFSKW